jgi:hypothetical protein
MMRRVLLPILSAAIVAPSSAQAAWGPVLRPSGSGGASATALAVGASGDVVTAWTRETGGTVAVRAAVGTRTHVLLRARNRAVTGLTAAMSARGEATVVWVEQAQTSGLRAGPITVRSAFRPRGGDWSAVATVSRSSAFVNAQPRLAVAPDGTVALTFNAAIAAAPGVGVAWRSRGHGFGEIRPVAGTAHDALQDPVLTFEPDGRLDLAGIARCGGAQSIGVLHTAAPGGRRLSGPRTLTGPPATHLRFVVTSSGRAVAAWVGAGCSTAEDLNGLVLARTLRDGALSEPALVDGLPSRDLVLAGTSGGAAEASWTHYPAGLPDGAVVTSRIAPDGLASMPVPAADGWTAVASTRRATRVVERVLPSGFGSPQAVGARAFDGGPVDVAPLPGPARFAVAAAPSGTALAAASPGAGALRVSVWRADP